MVSATVYTLGCKLNQSESESIVSSFDDQGFLTSKISDNADLYIVNSCTVTTKAEQKARRIIRKFAKENPMSIVLVTGCYAQVESKKIGELENNVFIVSMDRKHLLLDLPNALKKGMCNGLTLKESVSGFLQNSRCKGIKDEDRFMFDTTCFKDHARAYLKIQDGCNNNCAYCRVTIARGDSISLKLCEVHRRALDLERAGYREIIITGVNISDYMDPDDHTNRLPELINKLTSTLKTVRIRLSSLEPNIIDSNFLSAVAHKAVVPHFHISVQSGSNTLLEKINRHYTTDIIRELVTSLRTVKNDPFIAADLIFGLPGESEDDFMDSYQLIKDLDFSQIHIFPYSQRPGTALFNAKNRVPERITGSRVRNVRDLASTLHRTYLERWIGREIEVILERYISTLYRWTGLSENYLHVKLKGLSEDPLFRGRLVSCRIESIGNEIECGFIRFL